MNWHMVHREDRSAFFHAARPSPSAAGHAERLLADDVLPAASAATMLHVFVRRRDVDDIDIRRPQHPFSRSRHRPPGCPFLRRCTRFR
jgi:hypothetical protein